MNDTNIITSDIEKKIPKVNPIKELSKEEQIKILVKNILEEIKSLVITLENIQSLKNNNKNNPLSLYSRLIKGIHSHEITKENIKKIITSFAEFFKDYDDLIIQNCDVILERLPRNTRIKYDNSNKIYIDIQRFFYKATDEERMVIRRKLLSISAFM